MKNLGYYNGTFGPLEEMTIPMNDRAGYFGDGVYEATLARNGKIFALEDHLNRFYNSAGLIRIPVPYTRQELTDILYSCLLYTSFSKLIEVAFVSQVPVPYNVSGKVQRRIKGFPNPIA